MGLRAAYARGDIDLDTGGANTIAEEIRTYGGFECRILPTVQAPKTISRATPIETAAETEIVAHSRRPSRSGARESRPNPSEMGEEICTHATLESTGNVSLEAPAWLSEAEQRTQPRTSGIPTATDEATPLTTEGAEAETNVTINKPEETTTIS